MWRTALLYRLLFWATNSADSLNDAAASLCSKPAEVTDAAHDETHSIVHYYGKLHKEKDAWFIKCGLEKIKLEISNETVGFRYHSSTREMVHIFASVPIEDPDAEFSISEEEQNSQKSAGVLLITNDLIFSFADQFESVYSKFSIILEFYFLAADLKTTSYMFMTNNHFARSMICCLAYIMSCKIDRWTQCNRIENLVNDFNKYIAPSIQCEVIDYYRIAALLQLIGDDLCLSDNSVISPLAPLWPSFLAAYALVHKCSVWDIQKCTLAQKLLKRVPSHFCIPPQMLCWFLDPIEQDKLIKDLLTSSYNSATYKESIESILFDVLLFGQELRVQRAFDVFYYLFSGEFPEHLRDRFGELSNCKLGPWVREFLSTEYGIYMDDKQTASLRKRCQ